MFNDDVLNSISEILKKYDVYLVGGYLRNYFIKNEISNDRDLVCTKGAINLAYDIKDSLKATFIELDSENKIYRVVLKDKENYFDISEAIENDILKDAKRRDFTINSIFYNLNKKEFFDPLKGIDDIKNKIIKCINFDNLIDDPLRMLRMYRFFSLTGFEIEKELLNFTIKNFNLVEKAAKERINQEIIHIFEGEYTADTLLKMFENGTLEMVFPFVKDIKKIPPNTHHHLDLVHHSIETVRNIRINNPFLKIAAFYHDIGKPATWTIDENNRHRFIAHDIVGAKIATSELKDLKFSKRQIGYITSMIRLHIYPATLIGASENKKAFARFVRRLGKAAEDIIELARADRLSARGEAITQEIIDKSLKHLDNLLNYYNEAKSIVATPKTLLNGKEVMEILSIPPSKKVGHILEALLEAQIAKTITTKDEAISFVKNFITK